MRGKPRGNDGGAGNDSSTAASGLHPVIATGDGVISDSGKPIDTADTGKPDGNAGGIAPPEYGFGTIEAEEPVLTRIDAAPDWADTGAPGPKLTKSGRPDGRSLRSPRARTEAPKGTENLKATNLLLGIHEMLAQFTGIPEFRLAESEAKEYGDATIELMRELDIPITRKQVAIGNFVGAVTKIYATRFTAYKIRRQIEKNTRGVPVPQRRPAPPPIEKFAPPQQPPQGTIVSMPTPANAQQVNGAETSGPRYAPSEIYPEPAADFPGLG